jgi:hypothetical protein
MCANLSHVSSHTTQDNSTSFHYLLLISYGFLVVVVVVVAKDSLKSVDEVEGESFVVNNTDRWRHPTKMIVVFFERIDFRFQKILTGERDT